LVFLGHFFADFIHGGIRFCGGFDIIVDSIRLGSRFAAAEHQSILDAFVQGSEDVGDLGEVGDDADIVEEFGFVKISGNNSGMILDDVLGENQVLDALDTQFIELFSLFERQIFEEIKSGVRVDDAFLDVILGFRTQRAVFGSFLHFMPPRGKKLDVPGRSTVVSISSTKGCDHCQE
jgi:hypothetical protein